MKITFYKYQGTGNDFVIIDNRENLYFLNQTQIAFLCDRRFGIGADGLMLLQNKEGYDFEMIYYNSDGNQSSMCGNGGRCLVMFAFHLGIFKEKCTFLAIDGLHDAIVKDNQVHLKMIDVDTIKTTPTYTFLNTGSPHHIEFVDDVNTYPIVEKGKSIRYSAEYEPKGTNVNFVQKLSTDSLFVRTYERGVEDETYSCGTGVTAAALASSLNGCTSPVKIKTLGGNLEVSFENKENIFSSIYLIGPALRVFEGTINI